MFHGIEELHKDCEGFVYWRGIQVEHYSYSHDKADQERVSAADLALRCRHIEALGLKVNGTKVVWCWSWFAELTPHEPFLALFDKLSGVYENDEGVLLFTGPAAESLGAGAVQWNGSQKSLLKRTEPLDPLGLQDEFGYHGMRKMGFDILKAGQEAHLGTCYCIGSDLIHAFRSRNVPVDLFLA